MKVFITGACGMVGSHLIEYYAKLGIKPLATYHTPTIDIQEVAHLCDYVACDIRNADHVHELMSNHKPDIIYHLAAQSYPVVSWSKPVETMNVNANGTIHVFESIKLIRKSEQNYDPMVVVACSSAQYGNSLLNSVEPVTELAEFLPLHPYGVSKVAQDLLSYQYFASFGIRCIRARIFNTTGVRKVNDVVSDFTRRATLIKKGKESVFSCGNLETKRAIMDVRDLVKALVTLSEKGRPGEAYNICGETIYKIQDVVDLIKESIGLALDIRVDPTLLRVTDEPIIVGNSMKLKQETGWKQEISLQTTIHDMLQYWDSKL